MIYFKSERDRISNTRPFLFFVSDDLWMFRLCVVLFSFLLFFIFFVSGISLFSLFENFFYFSGVAKVSRIDTQSQKAPELAFPIPRKFLYFILLSHKWLQCRIQPTSMHRQWMLLPAVGILALSLAASAA